MAAQAARALALALAALAPQAAALQSRSKLEAEVAVFVQVGSTKYWPDMRQCIAAVAQADLKAVDLYLSFIRNHSEIEEDAKNITGLRTVSSIVAENRGADIGQFLQQLRVLPAGSSYTASLKMHTKSDNVWRQSSITSLCSSPAQVTDLVRSFIERPTLGIVGADILTWSHGSDPNPPRAIRAVFPQREIPAMMRAWVTIDQKTIPKKNIWTIVAGSMYWARDTALLQDVAFMKAIPRLLAQIPPGTYRRGSCCQIPHGLERVIPTRAVGRGLAVEKAPSGAKAFFRRRVTDEMDEEEICRILEEGMYEP